MRRRWSNKRAPIERARAGARATTTRERGDATRPPSRARRARDASERSSKTRTHAAIAFDFLKGKSAGSELIAWLEGGLSDFCSLQLLCSTISKMSPRCFLSGGGGGRGQPARGGVCGFAVRGLPKSEEVKKSHAPLTPPSTDRNWARRGRRRRRQRSQQQSVANELGRNDHDDGGGVHDALIRDRQKQKDEAVERRGEAEADC